MEGEERPLLGRRVVVYGGGDTALDAARTAKRLGAEEAVIVYRRTRDRMPAHDIDVEEALEEGVLMRWLSTIKHADEGKLVIERMELDETGFPQPTGELDELEADSLILALGQESDLGLLERVTDVADRRRRRAGRPRPDDRPPGHLLRRRHRARRSAPSRPRPATGATSRSYVDAYVQRNDLRARADRARSRPSTR